jgi:hypothetical protein
MRAQNIAPREPPQALNQRAGTVDLQHATARRLLMVAEQDPAARRSGAEVGQAGSDYRGDLGEHRKTGISVVSAVLAGRW